MARHLMSFEDIELIVTSRDENKAQYFADELTSSNANARVTGVGLILGANFKSLLAELKPFIVVDCTGPFQSTNFDTAKAVFLSGSHMVDIADAREYLINYSEQLNEISVSNGVCGFAGASSTPALSSAVVCHLCENWQRVDGIDICITPGGKNEVGLSVIEAILSYAGKKIPVWKEGNLATTYGWLGSRITTIPGLGRRRVAPVETCDAELLGKRYSVTSQVRFSAGLESGIEQWGLYLLARLRKLGVMKRLTSLAPLLRLARKFTRLTTSDSGGMQVEIIGLNEHGIPTKTQWTLVAKHDHGPYVPILPAAAAIRLLLSTPPVSGAFLACEKLPLTPIENEMKNYAIDIKSSIQIIESSTFPAYFGQKNFRSLPKAVRQFHATDSAPVWVGEAEVQTGENVISKVIARLFGFPEAGKKIPLTVTVERQSSGSPPDSFPETWTRNFNGRSFSSKLTSHQNGVFTESFGPFTFVLGVSANSEGLVMPILSWKFLFLPLPKILAPQSETREYEDEAGRFRFDVRLVLPILGPFARYRGWLKPRAYLSKTTTQRRAKGIRDLATKKS